MQSSIFPLFSCSFGCIWPVHRSMAGEQGNRTSCSEDEIQSMVRGIFGQLFERRQSTQSMQHGTISSELNQAFRLPRNINTSNTSTTIAVEGEPGPGPSQPVSLPQQSLTLSVPSFNSQLNYGNVNMGRRSGPIRPRRSGTRRRSNMQGNGCSSQPSSSDRNELFLKDVYLLPRPTYDRVPRREAKANLQKEGFCVDAYTFDKRWDEQTLRDKMAMLFRKILKDVTRY